jgi:uncharacterized membrane protein
VASAARERVITGKDIVNSRIVADGGVQILGVAIVILITVQLIAVLTV